MQACESKQHMVASGQASYTYMHVSDAYICTTVLWKPKLQCSLCAFDNLLKKSEQFPSWISEDNSSTVMSEFLWHRQLSLLLSVALVCKWDEEESVPLQWFLFHEINNNFPSHTIFVCSKGELFILQSTLKAAPPAALSCPEQKDRKYFTPKE